MISDTSVIEICLICLVVNTCSLTRSIDDVTKAIEDKEVMRIAQSTPDQRGDTDQ